MENMDFQWIARAAAGLAVGGLVWTPLSRYVRNRTLTKTRTPLGATIYTWKTPLGRVRTARTHPAQTDRRGDGGFEGGDWGDCGEGDGGD